MKCQMRPRMMGRMKIFRQGGCNTDESTAIRTTSPKNQDGRTRGTEPKKKMKSRSMKRSSSKSFRATTSLNRSQSDRSSAILCSNPATPQKHSLRRMPDASPNYLKPTSCSEPKNINFHASPRSFESSFDGYDWSRKDANIFTPNKAAPSQKAARTLTRKYSFKPLRSRAKVASLKSKKPLMEKFSQGPQFSDLGIHRATCSSTLKDSRFPNSVELHPEGNGSERTSVMKVCPYSYCCLNGHHHAPFPPLKRFLSRKRRVLKTQMSLKQRSQSQLRAKHYRGKEKEIQTNQMALNEDLAIQGTANPVDEVDPDCFTKIYVKSKVLLKGDNYGGDDEAIYEFAGGSITEKEICYGGNCETSYHEKGFENLSTISDFLEAKQDIPVKNTKSLECCCIQVNLDKSIAETTNINWGDEEVVAAGLDKGDNNFLADSEACDKIVHECHEEVPVEGKVLQGVHREINSVASNSLKNQTAVSKEKNGVTEPDHELIQMLPHSEAESTPPARDKIILDKQNYSSLWHLLYHNVASHVASEVKTQQCPHGTNDEKIDDAGSSQKFFETDQDMAMGNHDEQNQDSELNQIDAIKLVQEAVDAIFPPETEDQSPDDQPVTTDLIINRKFSKGNHGEGGEQSISRSFDEDSSGESKQVEEENSVQFNSGEISEKAGNAIIINEGNSLSKLGDKPQQKLPKSWSNLKKLILLQRFVKELGKVRKFNRGVPQHLPLEHSTEAKKFYLRHQTMDGRKNAEEWLIDYALRQVVAKLTPARRRKVELLVEAFETVIPFPEAKGHLMNDATASIQKNMKWTSPSPLEAKYSPDKNEETETTEMVLNGGPAVQDTTTGSTAIASAIKEVHRDSFIEDNFTSITKLGRSRVHGVEAINDSADEDKTGKKDTDGKLVKNHSSIESSPGINLDKDSNLLVEEQSILVTSPKLNEMSVECNSLAMKPDKSISEGTAISCKDEKLIESSLDDENDTSILTDDQSNLRKCCGKVLMAGQVQQEKNKKVNSGMASGLCKDYCGSNGATLVIDKLNCKNGDPVESAEINGRPSSAHICNSIEEPPTVARNDKCEYSRPYNGFLEEDPSFRVSESNCTSNVVNKILLDKQKYSRMWQLLYQNALSHVAEDAGTQLSLDRIDKEKHVDGTSKLHGMISGSCRDFYGTAQDNGTENGDAAFHNSELNQIDAIKLVKEAVDAIFPPETQDHSSDVQSIIADTISDQNLSGKNQGEGTRVSVSTSTKFAESSFGDFNKIDEERRIILDAEETQLKTGDLSTSEEKKISKIGNRHAQLQSKESWNKLKRIILLKRFIKEMDRVRKFNPQEPQHLPVEPGSKAEKVHLRHQRMDERRKAEEWMLDYALQQVVAELSPARKRRVALLVEAFETVNPLSELNSTPTASTHPTPIQSSS
ncbi:calmodulin binding protein PICBP-like isoform X2 [Malania oleifera]|uniref:calmodulin binding protein PICBP-like isoform X2 n=1 Tax=Malania oleifera TaxID=397392 RepID=UPI0025AE300F|nr:calmodulin binding protein PICBP-like isoform X2 [Malania oleifera]